MYLKSIELSGFKSFAKKSELQFTSKISAIVGPNGSGKSNVAEAFSFVLGEQSIKSLRGKRGEDLIWNGNNDVSRANRAGVKVVFDNSKKFLNIDFPEVTIERVVHRDGNNEYFINGSQVRLRDITELLASANIGSSGHHIISQGEADRILSATIKERKGMIEEALGLKAYQYKKEESLRKLEKTKENIDKVSSLRREIAPHIKFLKKQVEKIEKAESMREDLRERYGEYLARESVYLGKEKDEIEEKTKPLEKKLKDLDSTIEKLKRVISEEKTETRSGELIEKEEELHKVRKEREDLMLLQGELSGEERSIERLLQEEKRRHEQNENKTVPLREVENVLSRIETEVSLDGMTVSSLWSKIKEIVGELVRTYREEVDDERARSFEKQIKELREKIEDIKKKLDDLSKKEIEARRSYENVRASIEAEKDTKRDSEKEIFRLLAERQEVSSMIHDLHMRLEVWRRADADFKQEIAEGAVLVGQQILDYKDNIETYKNVIEERDLQEERKKQIEKIKIRLEDMGAGGGAEVLNEYKQANERDEFLANELIDLEKTVESLTNLIKDLEHELEEKFKSGLEKINTQFNELFSLMFGGGTAGLKVVKEAKRKRRLFDLEESAEEDLEEETQEYEDGVDVDVSLPRKRIKGLMMLSGGERALTSIALLFAISQVNPPPFIILDETDAALDEANSRKYGDMIENLSSKSQLILITHNRETMSRAGSIYGVTMGKDGVSKLLSISFDEASAVAK